MGGLFLFSAIFSALAVDQLTLSVEKIDAATWQAERINLQLEWFPSSKSAYRLKIGRIQLPQLAKPLENLTLDCRRGQVSEQLIQCDSGKLHVTGLKLDRPEMQVHFRLNLDTLNLQASLKQLAVAGGKLDLDLSAGKNRWEIDLQGSGIDLLALTKWLPPKARPKGGWSYSGQLNPDIHLAGNAGLLKQVKWQLELADFAFSDPDAANLAESLTLRSQGSADFKDARWGGEMEFGLLSGEVLTPFFYLNPSSNPFHATTNFSSNEGFSHLSLTKSHWGIKEVLDVSSDLLLDLQQESPIRSLHLTAKAFDVGKVYQEYLQPVVTGTPWGDLVLDGRLDLSLKLDENKHLLSATLHNLHWDDSAISGQPRRIGIKGLDGQLYWSHGYIPKNSWLSWQGGHLLENITLGASRIDFQLDDRQFRLTRQAKLPLLDGALLIDRLDADDTNGEGPQIKFDGMLTPVSMKVLSQALDWPELSGTLSGMLPGLTFQDGVVSVNGVLLDRIFDGDILFKDLRLESLFGVYPLVQANVEISKLDLETLTRTFSFGKITGRLDGYIHDLELEDWLPVAFDAHFHTPEDDDSRHRISQQAVDNISNLGGSGMSGALARTFLGFFDEFGYSRLGIGCRLEAGMCEMSGAGSAKQGYYLVEGAGIPRIDIVGFNRKADWNQLVEQLKQMSVAGAPEVR
ncbi:MAG: hypothetical protein DIZ78_08730 [endosymbiont of Escarpia spicata]|uniref:Dicarboxylate transport domain-containing protein n=1 Tax=endosymbiont of Escarpia spicata TaxID=2200908 RepID=A0A370DPE7_9GAMM|nr:MAG: hypothetical protein DIZ78_08730 [endosymbiont of Escarpia spicata]